MSQNGKKQDGEETALCQLYECGGGYFSSLRWQRAHGVGFNVTDTPAQNESISVEHVRDTITQITDFGGSVNEGLETDVSLSTSECSFPRTTRDAFAPILRNLEHPPEGLPASSSIKNFQQSAQKFKSTTLLSKASILLKSQNTYGQKLQEFDGVLIWRIYHPRYPLFRTEWTLNLTKSNGASLTMDVKSNEPDAPQSNEEPASTDRVLKVQMRESDFVSWYTESATLQKGMLQSKLSVQGPLKLVVVFDHLWQQIKHEWDNHRSKL